METHADIVLEPPVYTLPSIPGETADLGAFIVSIASLSHVGRPKSLHVFVNRPNNGRVSPSGSKIVISMCGNVPRLLERRKVSQKCRECLWLRRLDSVMRPQCCRLWSLFSSTRSPLSAATLPWSAFSVPQCSSSSTIVLAMCCAQLFTSTGWLV